MFGSSLPFSIACRKAGARPGKRKRYFEFSPIRALPEPAATFHEVSFLHCNGVKSARAAHFKGMRPFCNSSSKWKTGIEEVDNEPIAKIPAKALQPFRKKKNFRWRDGAGKM